MNAQNRASRVCNDAHERHELKVELEKRRKAEAAPDREKFLAFADAMSHMLALVPDACTDQGQKLEEHICIRIKEFAAWVERKAGEL